MRWPLVSGRARPRPRFGCSAELLTQAHHFLGQLIDAMLLINYHRIEFIDEIFGESQLDFEFGDSVEERVVAVIGHFD
jgi:hypothetical protein